MAHPISLSTALCRPTSSLTASSSPDRVNNPAACKPPVVSNTFCAARNRSGNSAMVAAATRTVSVAGECRVRCRIASRDAFPHTPHEDVV
ncbi:hypothetical protein MLGJGCBP_03742 [Rhodococcus sp. T7]|nr:hypothetical protein MLGJGCBP_03742 [Rhodococcus sp. T7]